MGLQPLDCRDLGSNPDGGMDVRLKFVACCVASGICDKMIIRSEEFYYVYV